MQEHEKQYNTIGNPNHQNGPNKGVQSEQRELVMLREIFSTFAEYGQKLHELIERICKDEDRFVC